MHRFIRYLERQRIERTLAKVRGRLLDVGCGPNKLTRMYGGVGIGADVFPWPGIDVLVSDAGQLPFPDRSFDTVSFVACLNHIPRRLEALREAHRVLRDDGVVLATMIPTGVSRLWHLINRPWDEDQTERGMKEGEVFGLNFRQLSEMFRHAGFEVVDHERFILKMNVLYEVSKLH